MTQLIWALSEAGTALGPTLLVMAACWDLPAASRRALVACGAAGVVEFACIAIACWWFGLPTRLLFIPGVFALAVPFKFASGLSVGPFSFLVTLAALTGSACMYLAVIVDAQTFGDALSSLYLAWPGAATQWALELVSTLALWRFFSLRLPSLLLSRTASHRFWGTAWLVPTLPLMMGIVYIPWDTQTLRTMRVGEAAACAVFVLVFLVFETCFLLCKMADSARDAELEAERLRRTEMLVMQQRGLETRMDEARAARHDMRQHWTVLLGMLEKGDAEGALAYVRRAAGSRAVEEPLRWCENAEANAVLAHYLGRARELGARLDVRTPLPARLPQATTDVVVVLGNLLENADLALEGVPEDERSLVVRTLLRDDGQLLIAVDNACASPVLERDDGTFLSTRHDGPALGIQSVRMTAQATGGEARFEHAQGVFRASVLLGPGAGEPATDA